MSEYDISLEKQEVLVKGTIPYDDLHAKIAKTGKQVRAFGATGPTGDRVAEAHMGPDEYRSSPERLWPDDDARSLDAEGQKVAVGVWVTSAAGDYV